MGLGFWRNISYMSIFMYSGTPAATPTSNTTLSSTASATTPTSEPSTAPAYTPASPTSINSPMQDTPSTATSPPQPGTAPSRPSVPLPSSTKACKCYPELSVMKNQMRAIINQLTNLTLPQNRLRLHLILKMWMLLKIFNLLSQKILSIGILLHRLKTAGELPNAESSYLPPCPSFRLVLALSSSVLGWGLVVWLFCSWFCWPLDCDSQMISPLPVLHQWPGVPSVLAVAVLSTPVSPLCSDLHTLHLSDSVWL